MTYQASVTFERDHGAPMTWRGPVSATAAWTAASRAVKAARHAHPLPRYGSVVVVLQKVPLAAFCEPYGASWPAATPEAAPAECPGGRGPAGSVDGR